MADDDRGVRERLAALEAEVKAEADAARARKDQALERLRARQSEQVELRARQQALLAKKSRPSRDDDDDRDRADTGLGGMIDLANKANRVRNELTRKPGKGEKSLLISGGASLALGPLGWLYAGSWREAVPAATVWVLLAALASKILPTLLLWPVLMVVMPLSGIAGVIYAHQFNRHGARQRLFESDEKKQAKQLKSGRAGSES